MKEVGCLDSPFGLAGHPKVVAKIHDAFRKALDAPTVLAAFEKFEMVPNFMDTAAYTTFVQDFMVSERKALGDIGLAKEEERARLRVATRNARATRPDLIAALMDSETRFELRLSELQEFVN